MIQNTIKLSSEFKTQTTKTIFSLILFAFVYLIIVFVAVVLTVLCIYGGIGFIANYPSFITIALGLGLASLGVLILIFVFKFIFSSNKFDRSHLHEIRREDEPEVFKLLDEIVTKVGTRFPKRVYLSAEVNASVFYDSSFWSMFMPIEKNLQIGVGLVNAVTHDELKAILAHEFGHFSQRTMKVGSYVYNVNQVIYNMLNNDESYQKMINGWASASGYFVIFVIIAIKIIEGIQWVLRKMYGFVNKSYMALSREMEFHADETAAKITGYAPLKSSLLRMNIADYSFNSVLSFYEGKISDNLKSSNIFREQAFAMNFYAKEDNIPLQNGFPSVGLDDLNKFDKSKLVIKNQWASHPSTQERIERLEKTGLVSDHMNNTPANAIFKDIEALQKRLCEFVFSSVQYKEQPQEFAFEMFSETFVSNYKKAIFSSKFNAYYDNKNPSVLELDHLEAKEYNNLFSDEMKDLVLIHIALNSDINTLDQITDATYGIKTFDYDGERYKRKDARVLKDRLTAEMSEVEEQIKQNDIRIFQHFKAKEQNSGKSYLKMYYEKFYEWSVNYEMNIEKYLKIIQALNFTSVSNEHGQIKRNFKNIEPLEAELKGLMQSLLENPKLEQEITGEMRTNFDLYLSNTPVYFDGHVYIDNNLSILYTALHDYAFLLGRAVFIYKQQLLDYQASFID